MSENADRRAFAQRANVQQDAAGTILDDGPLCVSAGFCGTRTTDVWKLLGAADDPETFSRMRGMIWNCPSGRLVLRSPDGTDLEPELAPAIAFVPGGPIWVRGRIPVVGSDGSPWEV